MNEETSLVAYPKDLLTRVGAHLPSRGLIQLQAAVNYLKIGHWMAERDFHFPKRAPTRQAVFDSVIAPIRDRRVLVLEFGVFRGQTTRYWSERLRNPKSILHGFDSFEGLPEDWGPHSKGHFDLQGAMPKIDDPRVKFFKGWFDQVLPTYSPPEHDELVLILDADLYSSTKCVLEHLRPHIKPGTYLYFDEMNQVDHEPRAFDEFMQATSLRFRPLCADRTLQHVFFQCEESRARATPDLRRPLQFPASQAAGVEARPSPPAPMPTNPYVVSPLVPDPVKWVHSGR